MIFAGFGLIVKDGLTSKFFIDTRRFRNEDHYFSRLPKWPTHHGS